MTLFLFMYNCKFSNALYIVNHPNLSLQFLSHILSRSRSQPGGGSSISTCSSRRWRMGSFSSTGDGGWEISPFTSSGAWAAYSLLDGGSRMRCPLPPSALEARLAQCRLAFLRPSLQYPAAVFSVQRHQLLPVATRSLLVATAATLPLPIVTATFSPPAAVRPSQW